MYEVSLPQITVGPLPCFKERGFYACFHQVSISLKYPEQNSLFQGAVVEIVYWKHCNYVQALFRSICVLNKELWLNKLAFNYL